MAKRYTQEWKNNIAAGQRERFLQGATTWCKGLTKETHPGLMRTSIALKNNKERGKNISLSKLGKKRKPFSEVWRQRLRDANIRNERWKGQNNPSWKPFDECKHTKYGLKYKQWTKFSKELRSSRTTCEICKEKKPLVIHHIIPYKQIKNNSLSNLQVICGSCHAKIHNKAMEDARWKKNPI